jgi:serine/threonine protein kinase
MAETVATHDFLGPPTQAGDLGTLAHYRVIDELGKGGMGYVFRAEDSKLQRSVALKVMNKKIAATSNSRQRFLHEARAMAAVRHDNVATIFEVGESSDGTAFMAMEMLRGGTLETFNKEKHRLGYEKIIEYARQVSRGLSAAHSQGIVHRDIKPANIWIEEGIDRIKILDFGLALASTPVDHLSGRGAVIGTPGYLSPEQARSEPLDDRSDLYSLGVVLYELATGQLPLQSGSVSGQLIAILTQRPTPVDELNPDIPKPLCDLIHRLLRKEPRSRPQSALELETELERVRQECDAKSEVAQAINKLQVGLNEMVYKSDSSSIIDAIDEIPGSVPDPLSSMPATTSVPVGAANSGRFVVPTAHADKRAAPSKPNWMVYAPLLAVLLVIVTVLPLTAFFFNQMGRSTEPILVTQIPSSDSSTASLPIESAADPKTEELENSLVVEDQAQQALVEVQDQPVVENPSPQPVDDPTPTVAVNAEPTAAESSKSDAYAGTSPTIRAILEREAEKKRAAQEQEQEHSKQQQPETASDSEQTLSNAATVAANANVEPKASGGDVPLPDANVKVVSAETATVEISKQPIDDAPSENPPQRSARNDPPESPEADKDPEAPAPEPKLVFRTISTDDGRGADVMVRKGTVDNLADKPTISVRTRNTVEIEHSYLRFDLASIESVKKKTDAAELFLVVNSDQPIDGTVRVYGIANPQITVWPERRVTWKISYSDTGLDAFPVLAEQTFSFRPDNKASRVVRISSPALVQFIIASEHDVVTFALAGSDLAGSDQQGKDRIDFFSSRSPTKLAPRLRVKVPEPPPPDPLIGMLEQLRDRISKLRAVDETQREKIIKSLEKKQFDQAIESIKEVVEKLPELRLPEKLKDQLKKQAKEITGAIQKLADQRKSEN